MSRSTGRGGPGVVRIEVGPRNSSYIHGTGVVTALNELGVPHMFCPFRKVRCVPTNRLDDVIALLEYRHRRRVVVTLKEDSQ